MASRRPPAPKRGRTGSGSPSSSQARPTGEPTSRAATGDDRRRRGGRTAVTGRSGTSRPTQSRPLTRGAESRADRPADSSRVERVSATAARGGRPPRLLTVRAIVLFAILLVSFIVLFPTLSSYLAQQQSIASLKAQVSSTQDRNEQLQAEIERWQDPAFVQAQARDRLSFVMPGETPYKVIDPESATDPEDDGQQSEERQSDETVWYRNVWDSLRIAGAASTG